MLGCKPTMLRPPYGAVGSKLRENCDEYLIGWSVDTEDWKYRDKDKVVASVKNEGDLDGDVILMHSLYESTADAVKELVPWLIENGYQLVTVSELMKYRYETELETGKYYSGSWFIQTSKYAAIKAPYILYGSSFFSYQSSSSSCCSGSSSTCILDTLCFLVFVTVKAMFL